MIVPTNTAGVMARRALGRLGGVAAVDMLTLYRLAELIGSPALVADGRSPVSTAVVDLAIRRVLADAPGSFGPVAEHPSTVVALRDLHRELRLAGPDAVAALAAASSRGSRGSPRQPTHVAPAAGRLVRRGRPARARRARHRAGRAPTTRRTRSCTSPSNCAGASSRVLRALGDVADVRVILGLTGDAGADAELGTIAAALQPGWSAPRAVGRSSARLRRRQRSM